MCSSCAAFRGCAGCSRLVGTRPTPSRAVRPAWVEGGSGCHAPQAAGTARGVGRREMMGQWVRDRPDPRAYPRGALNLERVAPARAVGRVFERLEPSGLAPGRSIGSPRCSSPGHRSCRARSSIRTIVIGRSPSDSSGSLQSAVSVGTSWRYRTNRPRRSEDRLARGLPCPPEGPPLLPVPRGLDRPAFLVAQTHGASRAGPVAMRGTRRDA